VTELPQIEQRIIYERQLSRTEQLFKRIKSFDVTVVFYSRWENYH